MTASTAWPAPTKWPQVPFRRLYYALDRPVPEDADIVTAYTDGQVTRRSQRDKIGYHEARDLSGYQGVQPGDLVVHGLDILRGSVGVSDSWGAMSSVCTVCAPRHAMDPRYVALVIRAQAAAGFTRVLARGIREGGADFRRWDTLGELPIPSPPLDEQRRIADFLEDQVARIDEVIRHRRSQLELTGNSRASLAADLFEGLPSGGSPLSAVARIIDTEHKTAPDGEGGGFFVAGTNAIRSGRIVHEELREIDEWAYREWTRRAVPLAGDVLLTREAPIGQVALLEGDGVMPAIGQRVVLLRPTGDLQPEFLRLVLMSPRLDELVNVAAAGSLHPHLNMSDIARLRVPLIPTAEQARVGKLFTRGLMVVEEAESMIKKSLEALHEYKRSLITAAVTGELDVTTASTGVPA